MLECRICHKLKPESAFGRDKSTKTGYKSICKECTNKRYQKVCPACGKTFFSATKTTSCCSKECAGKLRRTRIKSKCEICGKEIEITPYELKRSEHHYCSVACMGKGESIYNTGERGKNYRNRMVSYNCDICGEENFKTLAEYQKYKHHYCSRKCKDIGQTVFCSWENSPRFDTKLTPEERDRYRNIEGYNNWRKKVYERDGYICQCCKEESSGNLVAHHLDGFKENPDLRVEIGNGITLCERCHTKFHNQYGRGGNTRYQFAEFLKAEYNIDFDDELDLKESTIKKVCSICGNTFYTNLESQKTCSSECKRILLGKSVKTFCDYCGKEIVVGKARYEKNKHHYCSTVCKSKGASEFYDAENNPNIKRKKVICDYCGKEFEISPYRLANTKHHYCSRACADKGYSKYSADVKRERLSKTIACDVCGKEISLPPNRMKSKHHYCSRRCQYIGQSMFKNSKE